MGQLHDALADALNSQLAIPTLMTQLATRKFRDVGIELTKKQSASLLKWFDSGDETGHPFIFTKRQEATLRASGLPIDGDVVNIIFTEEDAVDVERRMDDVIARVMSDLTEKTAADVISGVVKGYRSNARRMAASRRSGNAAIRKIWSDPLDLLDAYITVAVEAANLHMDELQPNIQPIGPMLEVLFHIYARGCQVASEIHLLLSGGHADGAHARWRTLHELAVIAFIITDGGDTVAQKYQSHEVIERFKSFVNYQEVAARTNSEPLDQEAFDELRTKRDELLALYGSDFGEQYGWACSPSFNRGRAPKFVDLEARVGLSHVRPYYRMANINVHADARFMSFQLGDNRAKRTRTKNIGPSEFGLADPGAGAALSLGQIAFAFLGRESTTDSIASGYALISLDEKVRDAFTEAHRVLAGD